MSFRPSARRSSWRTLGGCKGDLRVVLRTTESLEDGVSQPRGSARPSRPLALACQTLQIAGDVADELDLGDEVLVDLGRQGIDADDRLVLRGVPVPRGVLHEVVADRDHEVGLVEPGQAVIAGLQADGAECQGVVGVEQALGHERRRDRDAALAREGSNGAHRAPAHRTVAGEGDRVLGIADELGGPSDVRGRRVGMRGRRARERLALRIGRHHVLRQLDVRRSRFLGLGDLEGLANHLRDDRGIADASVPLRDGAHDLENVDVLVRLLVHPFEVALSCEDDDGRSVEERVRHPRHEVGGARTERRQADARAPGEAAVRVGHERCRLLVTHRHERDRRARQRLVEVDGLLAGHAEHVAHALGLEARDEEIRGSSSGRVRHPPVASIESRASLLPSRVSRTRSQSGSTVSRWTSGGEPLLAASGPRAPDGLRSRDLRLDRAVRTAGLLYGRVCYSVVCPQRDSNPCRRLERAKS